MERFCLKNCEKRGPGRGKQCSWERKELPAKKRMEGNSCHSAAETNPTRNDEVAGSIPGLAQWIRDLVLP